MKKSLCYILLVLIIPIMFLAGCSKNSDPVKIDLSTENYSQYLTFNVVYEDFMIDEENNVMYCTAKISTNAADTNLSFRYVDISYSITPTSVNTWTPVNNYKDKNIVTDINYDGTSIGTITLKATILAYSEKCLPTSKTTDIKIDSISGQVVMY